MSDCNGSVHWVTWTRKTDPGFINIHKEPFGAPPHRKPESEIRKGLIEAADRSVRELSEPEKRCPDGCLYTPTTTDPAILCPNTTVLYSWKEEFTMLDDQGHVIHGNAQYFANADVDLEKHKHHRECRPAFIGDRRVSRLLENVKVEAPATVAMAASWKDLPLVLNKLQLTKEELQSEHTLELAAQRVGTVKPWAKVLD